MKVYIPIVGVDKLAYKIDIRKNEKFTGNDQTNDWHIRSFDCNSIKHYLEDSGLRSILDVLTDHDRIITFSIPKLNNKHIKGSNDINSIGLGLLLSAYQNTLNNVKPNYDICCATGSLSIGREQDVRDDNFLIGVSDIQIKLKNFCNTLSKMEELNDKRICFIYVPAEGEPEASVLKETVPEELKDKLSIKKVNKFDEIVTLLYGKDPYRILKEQKDKEVLKREFEEAKSNVKNMINSNHYDDMESICKICAIIGFEIEIDTIRTICDHLEIDAFSSIMPKLRSGKIIQVCNEHKLIKFTKSCYIDFINEGIKDEENYVENKHYYLYNQIAETLSEQYSDENEPVMLKVAQLYEKIGDHKSTLNYYDKVDQYNSNINGERRALDYAKRHYLNEYLFLGINAIDDLMETEDLAIFDLNDREEIKNYIYETQIERLNEEIDSECNELLLYHNRACLYFETEQYDKGAEDFVKILNLSGRHEFYYFISCIFMYYDHGVERSNHKLIINSLSSIIEKINIIAPECYFYRAMAYGSNEEYHKAIEDYTKVLEIDSETARSFYETLSSFDNFTKSEIYFQRGNAYYRTDEFVNAISDYNKAIEFKPDNNLSYKNRSAIYIELKQYDKALSDLSKVLELNPEDPNGHYNLACLHSLLKDKDKSIEHLKTAIDKGYNDIDELEADEDLDFIRDTQKYRDILEQFEV